LHGGAEWPGGSYNPNDNSIVIPFNKEPWVIRMEYKDKIFLTLIKVSKELNKAKIIIKNNYKKIMSYFTIHNKVNDVKSLGKTSIVNPWEKSNDYNSIVKKLFSLVQYGDGNNFYNNKCSSCHGIGRQGFYENEFEGDRYIPSLIDIDLQKYNQFKSPIKELKEYHKDIDINFDEKFLLEMLENFNKYDSFLKKFNLLKINGFWQLLLDDKGYPASKPPWGGIAKINMNNGLLEWKIPFGKRLNANKQIISVGDKNFGGVLSTSSQIIFATGTPDEMARAFSLKDGRLLWEKNYLLLALLLQ